MTTGQRRRPAAGSPPGDPSASRRRRPARPAPRPPARPPAPEPAAAAAPAGGFAAAAESLRSATRWLLTAAAAAGGAMVAGLQLTSIGSLGAAQWPRLAVAIAAAAAAFAAVGYVISRTSRLLADEWITLAQLQLDWFAGRLRDSPRRRDRRRGEALERIYADVQDCGDELYGDVAESVADLYARLRAASAAAREHPAPVLAARAAVLRSAADAVVQYANYSSTRQSFAALRGQLARAASAAGVAVLVFAYAANPPPAHPARAAAAHARAPAARPQPAAPPAGTRAQRR